MSRPPSVPPYSSPRSHFPDVPSTSAALQFSSLELSPDRIKEMANALQAVFARIGDAAVRTEASEGHPSGALNIAMPPYPEYNAETALGARAVMMEDATTTETTESDGAGVLLDSTGAERESADSEVPQEMSSSLSEAVVRSLEAEHIPSATLPEIPLPGRSETAQSDAANRDDGNVPSSSTEPSAATAEAVYFVEPLGSAVRTITDPSFVESLPIPATQANAAAEIECVGPRNSEIMSKLAAEIPQQAAATVFPPASSELVSSELSSDVTSTGVFFEESSVTCIVSPPNLTLQKERTAGGCIVSDEIEPLMVTSVERELEPTIPAVVELVVRQLIEAVDMSTEFPIASNGIASTTGVAALASLYAEGVHLKESEEVIFPQSVLLSGTEICAEQPGVYEITAGTEGKPSMSASSDVVNAKGTCEIVNAAVTDDVVSSRNPPIITTSVQQSAAERCSELVREVDCIQMDVNVEQPTFSATSENTDEQVTFNFAGFFS